MAPVSTPSSVKTHRVAATGSTAAAAAIGNVTLVAHVQDVGDTKTGRDGWTGRRSSGLAIEGFAIHLGLFLPARGFSYQAAVSPHEFSEAVPSGEYCGTRGQNKPVFGLRILVADPDVEIVAAVPLEAIRLVLTERAPVAG